MNLQICSRAALEDMLVQGLPQNAAIISFCAPVGIGRHRHDDMPQSIFAESATA